MKVLLIHSGNKVGGDSSKYTFVTEQGNALVAQGCNVSYFAIMGHGLKGYTNNIAPLVDKIKTEHPDVVHAHYGLCGYVAVMAVRRLKKSQRPKVVVTFHGSERIHFFVNLLCSWFSLQADHVIYVAQHIHDKCLLTPSTRKTSIIPCGINLDELGNTSCLAAREQLGWSSNKRYILFGGSFLNWIKNYPLLRDAVKLLKQQPLDKPLEVVEMRGFTRAECALRMAACDCFCLCSFSEGSPQALKEAMAMGAPCVTTDVGDIRRLYDDMQGLYIVANRAKRGLLWQGDSHSVQELADCLQQAFAFSDQRLAEQPDAPRTQGRERILSLGLTNEQIAKRLIHIYQHILENK